MAFNWRSLSLLEVEDENESIFFPGSNDELWFSDFHTNDFKDEKLQSRTNVMFISTSCVSYFTEIK